MISVIVPVYNAEKTLKQCVDSILSQSFPNFELILVDDGSVDSSLSICNLYKLDGRVSVVHKDNGGVSSARNAGIDNSSGEWITFVDSDDVVSPNWLRSYYESIDKNPDSQLYVQNIIMIDSMGRHTVAFAKDYPRTMSDLYGGIVWGSVCNKLFNSAILQNNRIRFNEELRFSEDCLFVSEYCAHIDRYFFIKQPGYKYYYTVPYSVKYSDYISISGELALYQKIKQVNPDCANQLVDGLIMRLLKGSPESSLLAIEEFRRVVGRDIRYVKGLRKAPIKMLACLNFSFLWKIVFRMAIHYNWIW